MVLGWTLHVIIHLGVKIWKSGRGWIYIWWASAWGMNSGISRRPSALGVHSFIHSQRMHSWSCLDDDALEMKLNGKWSVCNKSRAYFKKGLDWTKQGVQLTIIQRPTSEQHHEPGRPPLRNTGEQAAANKNSSYSKKDRSAFWHSHGQTPGFWMLVLLKQYRFGKIVSTKL